MSINFSSSSVLFPFLSRVTRTLDKNIRNIQSKLEDERNSWVWKQKLKLASNFFFVFVDMFEIFDLFLNTIKVKSNAFLFDFKLICVHMYREKIKKGKSEKMNRNFGSSSAHFPFTSHVTRNFSTKRW